MHVYDYSDIGYNEQIRLDLGARFIRCLLYLISSINKPKLFFVQYGHFKTGAFLVSKVASFYLHFFLETGVSLGLHMEAASKLRDC